MKDTTWLEKLSEWLIAHNQIIERVFVILVVIAIALQGLVGINYDLTKYLPDTVASKQGIEVMKKEFGYPGTARIMLKDVSLYEAEAYRDQIAQINGVDSVTFLSSGKSTYAAMDFLNQGDGINDAYHDKQALMTIIFDYGDTDKRTATALTDIKELLGEKVAMTGPAVNNKTLNENVSGEMPKIMICAVIVILLILLLTTNSWLEPLLFMLTMGVAIILNMGSNIIFGEISFLSSSVAAVLQLAVAMDYSIFLLHTFTREKSKGLSAKMAIKKALIIAIPSILASALTTIIGFLALSLMQFKIGADMGLVLAKSIVWSLLTVIFLMPALIVRWHKWIEKTAHKSFVPALDKFAQANFRSRFVLAGLVAFLLLPAWIAQGMNNFMYGTATMGASKGSQAYAEKMEIEESFGKSNTLLIMIPNQGEVKERQLSQNLKNLDQVRTVTTLAEVLPTGLPIDFLPNNLTEQLQTENYTRVLLDLKVDGETEETFSTVKKIEALTKEIYGEKDIYVIGETPATADIKTTITTDYNEVNLISLLGVGLIILLTFKSLSMAVAVVIPIEIAVILNTALPYLYGDSLSFLGYLMVSSMQLGATVDYSILLTNNYLDQRKAGLDKQTAAIAAIKKSTLSILTSGTVLTAVGYTIYFVSSVTTIGDLGRLIGRGAFISMMMVLSLLPLLLTLIDSLILREQKMNQKCKQKICIWWKNLYFINIFKKKILTKREQKVKNEK